MHPIPWIRKRTNESNYMCLLQLLALLGASVASSRAQNAPQNGYQGGTALDSRKLWHFDEDLNLYVPLEIDINLQSNGGPFLLSEPPHFFPVFIPLGVSTLSTEPYPTSPNGEEQPTETSYYTTQSAKAKRNLWAGPGHI